MPAVLQQLMRRADIEATLRYDTGRNAETTSDTVWKALPGNTSGNSAQSSAAAQNESSSQMIDAKSL
jgi:hypothetical protein